MKKPVVKCLIAAAMMTAVGSSQADGIGPGLGMGIGVGAKYSTLGTGIEVGKSFTDFISVRFGVNQFSQSYDESIDDIDYDGDMDLSSTALMLDWHPLGGSFRLTAGYINSSNKLSVSATPTGSVTIGDETENVSAGDLVLDSTVKLGSGPYLGLGWGSVPATGFGFIIEAGIVQMGTPDVSLKLSGNDTALINQLYAQGDVDKEIDNMEDDLDGFDTYPVIGIGISYGF